MRSPAALIAQLKLAPHPEGGWYRETWRAESPPGTRAAATAILFLLESHQRSHWHRVDASEIWLWHQGDPLLLEIAPGDAGPITATRLGDDAMQAVVPPDHWQAARPLDSGAHGYTLVSCVVAPGFEFAGFTLAPPGWEPGRQ